MTPCLWILGPFIRVLFALFTCMWISRFPCVLCDLWASVHVWYYVGTVHAHISQRMFLIWLDVVTGPNTFGLTGDWWLVTGDKLYKSSTGPDSLSSGEKKITENKAKANQKTRKEKYRVTGDVLQHWAVIGLQSLKRRFNSPGHKHSNIPQGVETQPRVKKVTVILKRQQAAPQLVSEYTPNTHIWKHIWQKVPTCGCLKYARTQSSWRWMETVAALTTPPSHLVWDKLWKWPRGNTLWETELSKAPTTPSHTWQNYPHLSPPWAKTETYTCLNSEGNK